MYLYEETIAKHGANEGGKGIAAMRRIEKDAKNQFKKLSKKEQKRINGMKRVPVSKPGYWLNNLDKPRKKKWSETDLW